jgi:hypothetical protein
VRPCKSSRRSFWTSRRASLLLSLNHAHLSSFHRQKKINVKSSIRRRVFDMADDQGYQERRFYGPLPEGPVPPNPPKPKPKPRKQAPQDTVKQFWEQFNSKYPGKVFTILPDNVLARKKAARTPKGAVKGVRVAKSYEEAKAECERDVDRIIRECRRTNQKYKDPHFDMEVDLKKHMRDCIDNLEGDSGMKPRGVKRVTDIFEKPQFYIDDPTAGDVRQGQSSNLLFDASRVSDLVQDTPRPCPF